MECPFWAPKKLSLLSKAVSPYPKSAPSTGVGGCNSEDYFAAQSSWVSFLEEGLCCTDHTKLGTLHLWSPGVTTSGFHPMEGSHSQGNSQAPCHRQSFQSGSQR